MLTDCFFTPHRAAKLLSRIEAPQFKFYAHSYAFNLNYKHGGFNIFDLCMFASQHGLAGICTHIAEGDKSLASMSAEETDKLKMCLKELKLNVNLEVSDTSLEDVKEAVQVAKILGVENIRVYIRYGGRLLDIIKKGTEDLKKIADIAEENKLKFVLEPHEVLKSEELVQIIEAVDSPRVGLLFDFGNMVNAGEQPLDALKVMSPYIHQVHIKDIKIEPDRSGYKQIGVEQGTGDLPVMQMLAELILLGEDSVQVLTYGLEQEVGYVSPAFRFEDESSNPLIPKRFRSMTEIGEYTSLQNSLSTERELATQQVRYIRNMLEEIEVKARKYLANGCESK